MPECHFCYKQAIFTIVFSKGREVDTCDSIYCIGRLPEVSRDLEDYKIHSIITTEEWKD